MNVVNAFSVKPGILGNAPSPLLKMMKRVSIPSFLSPSAYSFGSVSVYWVEPSRFRSVIILCSTIFGMLIVSSQWFTEIILGDNYLSCASQLSHWLLRYAC